MTQKTMLDLTAHLAPYSQTYGDTTVHMSGGRIHKDEGPAVEHPLYKMWFKYGMVHRDNGPAVLYLKHPRPSEQAGNGEFIAEWYQHGEFVTSYQLDHKTFMEHWSMK